MTAAALTLTFGLTLFGASPIPPPPDAGEPAIAEPDSEPPPLEGDSGVAEPSAEPPPPDQPSAGGFGTVNGVTTESNVVAPTPSTGANGLDDPDGDDDPPPRREISLRAEIGYGQVDLANADPHDHQGLFLRAHVAFYPWLNRGRRVGVGFGLSYSYQGMNRGKLPDTAGFDKSSGQQQQVLFSLPLLFRVDPQWFSIQPSGLIGFAFYTGKDLYTLDRRSRIPGERYAFVAGGDLALCTAWDIVCLVGGSEYMAGIPSYATDPLVTDNRVLRPWGWHAGVGIDILRILDRGNRVD